MRVSLNWLKDFADIQAPAAEVSHRLTMAGLEIEGMEEAADGDILFEVNVTPNRPDCLSILGVAREAAAAFGRTLRVPDTAISGDAPASGIKVEISNPELCGRYAGRLISNVRVCETPEWIKNRLEKCGIRSLNNNIVDITNYVLLEMGHPLHAFDADKIQENLIRVAVAGTGRTITTLDGIERELPPDSLLIWDGRKPVAIAGVMGGEESAVTTSSTNIFLEAAYFEPYSVRRTSKKLGLRSEASYRFERGTDIEFLENALDRAALLMQETGGGTIHRIVDAYPVKYAAPAVEVRYSRVNSLLGTGLKNEEMLEILGRIGLKTEDRGDFFVVFPPSYRRDITGYVDVIEEIARIYNFSNIPVRNPRAVLSDGVLNRKEAIAGKIKESVRHSGFSEVINYSFMNPGDLDKLKLPQGDNRRKYLTVMNPLRSEEALMRTTLLPSLINNFLFNLSRGAGDVALFEFARVFINNGASLPSEELRLCGIYYREQARSVWPENAPSFFIVKGALQSLYQELNLRGLSYLPSQEAFLHKGKSADIYADGNKLGFIGELSPQVAEGLGLKVHRPEIIVFELDIDAVMAASPATRAYVQVPKYPAIERDIAVIMDEGITSAEALDALNGFAPEIMEKVELFDHYKGKNIPQDKKSLAFRIVYRSRERTLTDSEIETVHAELVAYFLQKTGGELRQ